MIVVVLALVALGFTMLDRTNITPDDAPAVSEDIPSHQPAPDVTFTRLDGGNVALHSLADHTVLLHFWASWCVPCRKEFSDLLERMEKDDGHTILLAVSGDADAADASRFLAP